MSNGMRPNQGSGMYQNNQQMYQGSSMRPPTPSSMMPSPQQSPMSRPQGPGASPAPELQRSDSNSGGPVSNQMDQSESSHSRPPSNQGPATPADSNDGNPRSVTSSLPAASPSLPSPQSVKTPGSSSQPTQQQQPQQQQQNQSQQQQQTKEINTATICRIGQETVQEIVARIQEVFSYLKSLQPPVGGMAQDRQTLEKQNRLNEVLKGITQLFKRLHVCWDKVHENTTFMEDTNLDLLIPFKDDTSGRDLRAELEKKRGDNYRQALDEYNEVASQLTMKNRQLKEIIDQMRNIIWEINTMLAMRHT